MIRRRRPANDPRVSASTYRKTLRADDLADELAARRAEERIVAEVPAAARVGVRTMLSGLRRRRFR